jgi:ABC-type transport system substrate-binding protein
MASHLDSFPHAEGFNLLIGRWSVDYDDPDNFTHYLFHSRAGIYRNYFSSAESDRILDEARSESRPRARETLYRKFENLLNEAGVLVPLFHDIDYRVASPKVRGLKLSSTPPHVNYSAVSKLDKLSESIELPHTGGGTIHVPFTGVVNTIDPTLTSSVEQVELGSCIYEPLLRAEGGTRIVPWLASNFKVEGGGTTYRFHLRDDVRFHDGRKLTARDVRYSFERLLQNTASETRWFYSVIRGAKEMLNSEVGDLSGFRILSANEFTIELNEPVSFFPAALCFAGVCIVPEGSSNFTGTWQHGCVGTGPFRVVKYETGRIIEVEANKSYWRKGFPKVDGLVFEYGIPPSEILNGFREGRFELAADLFPSDVEVLRRDPEFAAGYRETPRLSTYYAAFNIHREPFNDKGLRQSLAASIEVASLVRRTLGRMALPAHGFIPPGLLGHNPKHPVRDRHTTAAPLRVKPEVQIEIKTAVNPVYFGEYSAVFNELTKAFGDHNLKISPANKTMREFAELRQQGIADLLVTRWIADYPDADNFVRLLHSQEGAIGRFCSTPEIERLLARGVGETSPSVRHAIYREIEEIIAREALLLPLFNEQAYRFARPEVEGLSVSFWEPSVDYSNLRVND